MLKLHKLLTSWEPGNHNVNDTLFHICLKFDDNNDGDDDCHDDDDDDYNGYSVSSADLAMSVL
jgi:hypothetical protein